MNSIIAQAILSQIDQEAVKQRKDHLRVAQPRPATMPAGYWSADSGRVHEGAIIEAYIAGLLRAMRIVADQTGIKMRL